MPHKQLGRPKGSLNKNQEAPVYVPWDEMVIHVRFHERDVYQEALRGLSGRCSVSFSDFIKFTKKREAII